MESAYPKDLGHALGRLDSLLRDTVARVLAAYGSATADDPFRGLYISRGDITRLLDNWDAHPVFTASNRPGAPALLDGLSQDSRLRRFARAFGLGEVDLWLVVIALAPEVDLRYERLYAFLQDDVSRRRPSVDLALTLLSATPAEKLARRAHLVGDAPLVRHGLIALPSEAQSIRWPLPACSLVLDSAVVQHLLGRDELTADAGDFTELLRGEDAEALPPEVMPAAVRLLPQLISEACEVGAEPLHLYFSGPPSSVKKRTALALATEAGRPVVAVDLETATRGDEDWPRAVLREASLRGAIVYAEPYGALLGEEATAQRLLWNRTLAAHGGVSIISGTSGALPPGFDAARIVPVDFPLPEAPDRRAYWNRCLDRSGVRLSAPGLDVLAGRYRLTYDQIESATTLATTRVHWLNGPDSAPSLTDLSTAARAQSDPALGELAHAIEPVHGWSDLVLPEDTIRLLDELCRQVECRQRVLHDWGFGRRLSLGRGTAALFAGPSGTGKTTAAEIIAAELGLGLYKIDLAGVVSKYIGETEKNLQRIFAAAENANAVLFFDEADALFGKRSEVRDSHDRYANIEIAYLLQRMESYEGVAILATNLRQNMDEAFVRRLQFVVEFPFPDEEQRADIWRLHFPPEAPHDEALDLPLLARQFRMTGGSIKNAVLAAAYLAAADDRPIGMGDLLHATAREHAKAGRVLVGEDFAAFEERCHG
ncbi:ATPase AAA [Streptomyces albiflavescens]|uniref:ATPase AAA n=1 Tax=Streptomyces albiflavescens TaxID=1623582 RepID=A0A917YHL1_9ACTN|nr:ATP-binding protein [Streptomyces albiflavescens]GGN94451.1 ATPase AAA [Streptomyces albiflavescens]